MVSGPYFRLDALFHAIQGQIQEFKSGAPNSLSQIGKPLGGWVYCLPIFHKRLSYIYIHNFFQFIYYYNIVKHKHPHSPVYTKKNHPPNINTWTNNRTSFITCNCVSSIDVVTGEYLLVVMVSEVAPGTLSWSDKRSSRGHKTAPTHCATSGSVTSQARNSPRTLSSPRRHLAGTSFSARRRLAAPAESDILREKLRGHETAPTTLPSRGRHLAGTKQHPDTATSRASQGSQ